ncbi:uncharacterized protein LDX57_008255 [Aspergillus melleus]|uniref:uncharacterized protein n=1 Tax=Aspergillus melleus TaxID=138277 RepID=UPI001E8D4CF1|nr:uncharacterized protein LDX57_008255 [Aspergillus melleus]KAH8430591.1 hypothetical protein LDX57_008255 [Aspergillus melleus]
MPRLSQLFIPFLATVVNAQQTCPEPEDIVYSPFRPWFRFDYGPDGGDCWTGAICTLGQADAARNQQFAATALVMGLLPLVLRDIAWPERRVVLISAPLPVLAEVFVRALGLEPMIMGNLSGLTEEDTQRWVNWVRTSPVAGAGLQSRLKMKVLVVVGLFVLMVSYAALALVEIYSKRSALGCVYPVITLTWCVIGVVPAAVHVLFKTYWRRGVKDGTSRASAVQGADEAWPVQFAWAIYYIIGTLVFTSIMAITPLELFVWVVIMSVLTGASKMLALYICLMLRDPTQA